jgi:two-component system response regulator YesN
MIKLLIVDDESLLRQGFTHMTDWASHGFQIVGEAANGEEALEIIARHSPDIVVADIKMPVMDGIELTRIIKTDYPQIQIVILSSYDDFEYVRETLRLGAFDYILKPRMNFSDLLSVLEKASSVRPPAQSADQDRRPGSPGAFLGEWLAGHHFTVPEDIGGTFAKYGIQLKEINLTILAVVLDSSAPVPGNEVRQSLISGIRTALDPSWSPVSFWFSPDVLVTVFNHPAPADESCGAALAQRIMDHLHLQAALPCRILASPCFDGYHLLRETFEELVEKIPYSFYLAKNQYAALSRFQKTADSIEFDFTILHPLVERFNFEELRALVEDEVKARIAQGTYIQPYILKKFFSEICYLILYKGMEMGFQWKDVNDRKFECLKRIENSADYESLMESFPVILADLERFFTEHLQTRNNSLIAKVIKYIHQNYDQDISLETTAKHFFIDKSYLCKLFKKHLAQNFNDYLMQIRIHKAKELLNNPEYTVNAVSIKVGYSDYSYFGKIFKKMIGITPSEYKKSLLNTKK